MVTKPELGQEDWGPVLNAALDSLQGSADAAQAGAQDALSGVSVLQGDMSVVQGDVSTLQGQVSTLRIDVDALQAAPPGGGGKPYYRLVAASTASAAIKAGADYVCTGTADNTQIQAAIDAARTAGGGTVQLTDGTFNLAAPISITGTTNEDDPRTIALAGTGQFSTTLKPASNVNGIHLTDWAQAHIRDLGIVISGSGSGITATGVTKGDTLSFWHSSFRNLRISGGFNAANTGWGMDMQMPWRSTFENIEIEGTRNGMKLVNDSTVQNAGDCTFTRMFIEIVGTNGVAIHVSSPRDNMNQNNFNMVEAGANGTGCTGILIDGADGGASQRFWGLNLEQFETLINVANGESNVFECNYICGRDGFAGNRAFVCGSGSHNNTFSAKWINVRSSGALKVIEDNNTTSNTPNIFERIRIENNTSGTVTYTKSSSTVLRDITTFNTGNVMPAGLLQYPLTRVNDPTYGPVDQGFITWSHDPATNRSAGDSITGGQIYLAKVKVVNRSTVVTNIHLGILSGTWTLTAGQNFAGIYNTSGTRLGLTADQASAWQTAGAKTSALTAPLTLAVGEYYVALLFNGSAIPQIAQGAGASSVLNQLLPTAGARFLVVGSSLTALPSTITLSGGDPNNGSRWVALS
ncbi:hypothetical protein AB0942_33300 [Streptomyces nodosus]|uniref:hypothetical protein n=1 Tax=Streptomyces nodosus TaxID=40318 RepID=UPI0034557FAC